MKGKRCSIHIELTSTDKPALVVSINAAVLSTLVAAARQLLIAAPITRELHSLHRRAAL